jgi:hypothetical protein
VSTKPASLDDLHGDTPVARIEIVMLRSGLMLDTARATLDNYHIQQKLGRRSPIIVPAHDTSLVGTPEEKQLLAARDELSNAMAGT